MRRELKPIVWLAVASSFAGPACASDKTPIPVVTAAQTTEAGVESWNTLDPAQKIAHIQMLSYPDGIDPIQELISSASEVYCAQASCKYPPEELKRKVSFVEREEFLEKYFRGIDNVSEDYRNQVLETTLEFTDGDGNVFMSNYLIDKYVEGAPTKFIEDMKPYDIRMSLLKKLLFHSFAHANQSQSNEELSSNVEIEYEGVPLTLKQVVRGFSFIGVFPDGQEYAIRGLTEAYTELVGKEVGGVVRTPDIIADDYYKYGSDVLGDIMKSAGFDFDSLTDYYSGYHSFDELIDRILPLASGSTVEEKKANTIKALAYLGLYVDKGPFNRTLTEKYIFDLLPGATIGV